MKINKNFIHNAVLDILVEGVQEKAIQKFGKNIGNIDIDSNSKQSIFTPSSEEEIIKLLSPFQDVLRRLNLSNKQHLFIPLVLKYLTENNTKQFAINSNPDILKDLMAAFTCCVRYNNKANYSTFSKLNTVKEFYKYVSGLGRIESLDLCASPESGDTNVPTYYPKTIDPKDVFLFTKFDNKFRKKRDAFFIYDNNDLLAIRVNNVDASCYYGQHGGWCISRPKNGMFDSYEQSGKHFVIVKSFSIKSKYQNIVLQFHKNKALLECWWDINDRPTYVNISLKDFLNDPGKTSKLINHLYYHLNVNHSIILEMIIKCFKYFFSGLYKKDPLSNTQDDLTRLSSTSTEKYVEDLLKPGTLTNELNEIIQNPGRYVWNEKEVDESITEIENALELFKATKTKNYIQKLVKKSSILEGILKEKAFNFLINDTDFGPVAAIYQDVLSLGDINKHNIIITFYNREFKKTYDKINKDDAKIFFSIIIDDIKNLAMDYINFRYHKEDLTSEYFSEKINAIVVTFFENIAKKANKDEIIRSRGILRYLFNKLTRDMLKDISNEIIELSRQIKYHISIKSDYFDYIKENFDQINELVENFDQSILGRFDEYANNTKNRFISYKNSGNINRKISYAPNINNINLDFELEFIRDVAKAEQLFEIETVKKDFLGKITNNITKPFNHRDFKNFSEYTQKQINSGKLFIQKTHEDIKKRTIAEEKTEKGIQFWMQAFKYFDKNARNDLSQDYLLKNIFDELIKEFSKAFSLDLKCKLKIINFNVTIPFLNNNNVEKILNALEDESDDFYGYDNDLDYYENDDYEYREIINSFFDYYIPIYRLFFYGVSKSLGFMNLDNEYGYEDIEIENLPIFLNSNKKNTPGLEIDDFGHTVYKTFSNQSMANFIVEIMNDYPLLTNDLQDTWEKIDKASELNNFSEAGDLSQKAIDLISKNGITINLGKYINQKSISVFDYLNNPEQILNSMSFKEDNIDLLKPNIQQGQLDQFLNNLATELVLFINRGIVPNLSKFDQIMIDYFDENDVDSSNSARKEIYQNSIDI